MGNVISFSSYADEYLYYVKITNIDDKEYKTIIRINKKLVHPYQIELIRKLFNPMDFDMEVLGEYLLQNKIKFRIFLPLKNTKGFYKRHFPENNKELDYYDFQDKKNPMEKRDLKDFEYLDIFNKKTLGLFDIESQDSTKDKK